MRRAVTKSTQMCRFTGKEVSENGAFLLRRRARPPSPSRTSHALPYPYLFYDSLSKSKVSVYKWKLCQSPKIDWALVNIFYRLKRTPTWTLIRANLLFLRSSSYYSESGKISFLQNLNWQALVPAIHILTCKLTPEPKVHVRNNEIILFPRYLVTSP